MTFSLDRIVSHVKIDESDLISIHRSTHTIVPNNDNCLGHMCEAFICAARENKACRVYVALYDMQQKSNLVFIADPVSPKDFNALIRQAERFLNELGFSMEPVNVNFSPATREVILRDMKVTRPPRNEAVKRPFVPPDVVAQPLKTVTQPQQSDCSDTGSEMVLTVRLAETKIALEHLATEKEEFARKAAREFKKLKTERDRLRKELETAATARLDAEKSLDLIEKRTSAIIAALEVERDSLRSELAALAANGEGEVRTIVALKAERDAVCAELGSAREETETLRRKLADTRDELDAANCLLRQEIDRLKDELKIAPAPQTNEVEALSAALAIADDAISAERARNESALREMDALERNAAAELKKLHKKVDSLTAEKRLLESRAAEMKLKAKGEIERLQQVNQAQRRAAIRKVNDLKEEILRLAEARAAMASPSGPAPVRGSAQDQSAAVSRKEKPAQSRDVREVAALPVSPFACPDLCDNIGFAPDYSLKGVPYAVLEDVVEVHRSFNRISAAPSGKLVQKCDGFVCLVKNGKELIVYAAWLMNDTGEVLVCRPECVPDGSNDAHEMLSEGIGYFERIGFLMDRLHLDDDPARRQRQLDELTIFHWIAMERAA